MSSSRRTFLKALGAASTLHLSAQEKQPNTKEIKIGFIGTGTRGRSLLKGLLNVDGARIVAISEPVKLNHQRAMKLCQSHQQSPKVYSSGDFDYRNMLEHEQLDAVLIATPWRWHAKMAVESMEAGNHALVEIPVAETIEECWEVVKASEKTGKQCMMLENTCYGREELLVLNMVRSGLLGEITHAEGAYIHEMLKKLHHTNPAHGNGFWRCQKWTERNANLYPTHGLGPIAQCMNINRGDRFDYLVSMSSPSLSRPEYAKKKFPADHKWNKSTFITGDMNTSMIKTALGKTIMLQYDVSTPRPYSRINLIQGTQGIFRGYPERIMIHGKTKGHKWESTKDYHEEFEHPLVKKMWDISTKQGGHGGMDYLMLWRVIHCLKNDHPLDQDVYDAASWSVVTHLTEKSVANRSSAVDFPDFTQGKWENRPEFNIENI